MKAKVKKLLIGVLCSALVLTTAIPASACTGIYIGEDVSENGSTYMGRSEDMGGYTYTKIFGVSEARDLPADYVFSDAYGFSMPYGGHVYRYTYVMDSPDNGYGEASSDFQAYGEAGQNEKGVSVSATVSINSMAQSHGDSGYCAASMKADPLAGTGIYEISIASILLGKSATAREAVNLLADIVDKYGAGECNQITISDPDETWYFEIVSGHQYAAVKLPSDKVIVNPNIMMLGVIDVNDTANVVASKNLVQLAKDNHFLVTDENGKIDVAKSYAENASGTAQYERYMQGMFYINKAEAEKINIDVTKVDNNSNDSAITLFHGADRKMSTLDILHLLSTRGEGTPYAQDEGKSSYSIGNENQDECHVFEIRKNMPDALATIQWQALDPAEFTIFIPYYSALVTRVSDKYDATAMSYVDDSMFWTFSRIYEICSADRDNAGAAVKAYFKAYQQSLIDQQKTVDAAMQKIYSESPERASIVATLLGKQIAEQTFEAATNVKAELEAYGAAGNTGKAFTLSSKAASTMPVYAGLATKYTDKDEVIKALDSRLAAADSKASESEKTIDLLEQTIASNKRIAGVKATKLTASAKPSKDSVKLTWKKDSSYKVDSYLVYRAASKNGTYKLVREVKGATSVTLSTKNLKGGSTYYYKIRGVRTIDGKKIYTDSAVVSSKA